jgi:hypothetical protein
MRITSAVDPRRSAGRADEGHSEPGGASLAGLHRGPLPWQSRLNRGPSWLHGEGGLGEDARIERGVVGGDEFDLDQVLAGGEGGEAFVEAVVHGDQLAVDQQMEVALVGSYAGGGVGDDPGPGQIEADLGGPSAEGLAVVGNQDGELGG